MPISGCFDEWLSIDLGVCASVQEQAGTLEVSSTSSCRECRSTCRFVSLFTFSKRTVRIYKVDECAVDERVCNGGHVALRSRVEEVWNMESANLTYIRLYHS